MARYTNLDGTTPDKGLLDVLRWQLGRLTTAKRPDPSGYQPPRRTNDGAALRSPATSLTWIGHATFVQRVGGKLIATDPIWSERIQTVIPRFASPGVALADTPPLDIVTVSHAHYDHMDVATLQKIARVNPGVLFVVPRDNGTLLRRAGLSRVVELGWWETHREGDVAVTLVPAQHWSMRFPWDRNARLWGGFVYESPDGTSYHAGDTAFNEAVFKVIGERFPKIDWAMLPIGAYDPGWFMQPQHMGPEEAGRAFELLGARNLCAMHWGTFRLTDEPMSEPPERLRAWWSGAGHDASRLWIFEIGETRLLAR